MVAMIMLPVIMMTSSNGNIFRVTGPLCGELTSDRRIPRTKASDAELWCSCDLHLNKRLGKQSWGWWFETPSRSFWRHCNETIMTLVTPVMIIRVMKIEMIKVESNTHIKKEYSKVAFYCGSFFVNNGLLKHLLVFYSTGFTWFRKNGRYKWINET